MAAAAVAENVMLPVGVDADDGLPPLVLDMNWVDGVVEWGDIAAIDARACCC